MTLFVLDSDTISLLQDRHPKVIAHIASHAAADVATTIISVEEQLSAWYTLLRRATTPAGLVPIYQRMSETVRFFSTLPLLTFDDTAAEHYERGLLKAKPRTGRMDLRIAAIALAHRAAVVTRNTSDFRDIDGLTVLAWSARKPLFLPAYSCNSCYSWFASFKKSLAGKWTVGICGKRRWQDRRHGAISVNQRLLVFPVPSPDAGEG